MWRPVAPRARDGDPQDTTQHLTRPVASARLVPQETVGSRPLQVRVARSAWWLVALFVGLLVASSSGGSAAPAGQEGPRRLLRLQRGGVEGSEVRRLLGQEERRDRPRRAPREGQVRQGALLQRQELLADGARPRLAGPDRADDPRGLGQAAGRKRQAHDPRQAGPRLHRLRPERGDPRRRGRRRRRHRRSQVGDRPPTTCPLGKWTHIALTYDGASLRLFFNGAQIGTTTACTGKIAHGRRSAAHRRQLHRRRLVQGRHRRGADLQPHPRRHRDPEGHAPLGRARRTPRRLRPRPRRPARPALRFGIVSTRGVEHIDDVRKLGARITRIEFQIGADTGSMEEFVGRAARRGSR